MGVTSSAQQRTTPAATRSRYPLGGAVTLADLETDPHPLLARLRQAEPVSWLPALNGWLVTRRDLVLRVLRDSGTFTVDDPRFTTARVVGPSMLSLDGTAHDQHRRPFARPFSQAVVQAQLAAFVTAEAERLVAAMRPAGSGDLRRGLAAPLAVATMARALGLAAIDQAAILSWYDAIVRAVSDLARQQPDGPAADPAAGRPDGVQAAGAAAFRQLGESLQAVISASTADGSALAGGADHPGPASLLAHVASADGRDGALGQQEVISNAAVLMFGGIETTEGMITNAGWHLLSHPAQLDLVRDDPALLRSAIEESLRLEPAAALVDRYATRDVTLGEAALRQGDLVSVSLAAAGRDPGLFSDPDRFDVRRENASLNLAFARGPHFCLGVHLARLEARAALGVALRLLPGLRLDPDRPSAPRGLVFRKLPSLHARWDATS